MKWEDCGQHPVIPYTKVFRSSSLLCLVSREGEFWHLSISHPTRYPKWDEIKEARYALLPDGITMGILFPPKSEYVNIHPNCFHLHEVHSERIVAP